MGDGKELEVGMCIRIKRSDGTVHDAIISDLKEEGRSVMAEWSEGGEFKGKEITYTDVFLYNEDLKIEDADDDKPKRRSSTNIALPPKPVKIESRINTRSASAKGNVINSSVNNTSMNNSGNNSTVKEVEKLKKNRDERRVSQAKKKEEKQLVVTMNQDSRNWEYLSMIKEFRETIDMNLSLSELGPVEPHQITVCVRKRPMNNMELSKKEVDVITVMDKDTVIVHEPKCKVDLTKFLDNQYFKFDYAFDERCSNDIVYKYTAKPLVETVFEGGVATCFAYGQTGSGKTYTMGGAVSSKSNDHLNGIYAKTAFDFFHYLNSPRYKDLDLIVTASYFEIYREKLFDLLAGKAPLKVYEDMKQQINVIGLTEREVESVEEVLDLIREGNTARTCGKTTVNQTSSRSHAVFQLTLKKYKAKYNYGKFCLIDLAGNERGGQSETKRGKVEGADINKSLLALKECIRALGRKDAYLPFRGSKLTQVLRDAFVGDNARTCMIAMLSPGFTSCKNTLNTLRYADRVKELAAGESSSCEEIPDKVGASGSHPEGAELILTWQEKKERELKDEFEKYVKNSFSLTKKENELSQKRKIKKFLFKDYITTLRELLNERQIFIKSLLSLADEASAEEQPQILE